MTDVIVMCVMLRLRLTALNEEIGVQDHGNGEGDTYNDVMKDFSQRLQSGSKTEHARSSKSSDDA